MTEVEFWHVAAMAVVRYFVVFTGACCFLDMTLPREVGHADRSCVARDARVSVPKANSYQHH